MNDRDMMYGGYNVNMPGNYSYGNFGFQGPPGSIPIQAMMNGYYDYNQNNQNNNPINILNNRINSLETRVKNLEQKLSNMSNNHINNNSYQEDNSIYML